MHYQSLVLLALLMFPIHKISASQPRFKPVDDFELERYLGVWYEIARMPSSFEKDLVNVTATYILRIDGGVNVLNQGYKKTPAGKKSSAKGRAKFANDTYKGHLKVTFFWPFYADYIIIDIDKGNYRYAMVASNSFKYLWILSRKPALDSGIVLQLKENARSLGFDTTTLIMVQQNREIPEKDSSSTNATLPSPQYRNTF